MNQKAVSLTPEQALSQLEAQYERAVNALRKAIGEYIHHNILPDEIARAEGLFVYPQLSVFVGWRRAQSLKNPSLGAIHPFGLLHHHHY